MTVVAAVVTGVAVLAGVLALVTWGDGDPGPWIWISIPAAPLGMVLGAVAWRADRSGLARAALVVGLLVGLFWLLVFTWLISGLR